LHQKHPERGTKRICLNCGTRFYDLMRAPPVCPKCDTEFVAVVRSRPASRQTKRRKPFDKGHPVRPQESPETEIAEEDKFSSEDEGERPEDDEEDS